MSRRHRLRRARPIYRDPHRWTRASEDGNRRPPDFTTLGEVEHAAAVLRLVRERLVGEAGR